MALALVLAGFLRPVASAIGAEATGRILLAPIQEEALKVLLLCGIIEGVFASRHRVLGNRAQVMVVVAIALAFSLLERVTTYPDEALTAFAMRAAVHAAAPLAGMWAHREPRSLAGWMIAAFLVHAIFNSLQGLPYKSGFGAVVSLVVLAALIVRPIAFAGVRPIAERVLKT